MMRRSLAETARSIALAFSRATLTKADDSTKLQTLSVEGLFGEKFDGIEHWHPYGFTSVPKPPLGGLAEVLLAFLGANRSHPVALSTADRRSRPKNLKEGESAHHDDQGQVSKIGRDGHELTAKTVQITGGGEQPKGDTANHELNEFMKGVRAEIAQIKDSHHAMFDALSQLRINAENVIPALAPLNLGTQVTAALNGLPSGLDSMLARAGGKLQSYFQTAAQQALTSFLDPSRLLNVASLLSGGLEAAITAAKNEIAALIAANPIIQVVDDLQAELAALNASGNAADVIASKGADLAAQIAGHTAANAVIGQVANLRATLQGYLDQAGDALHFLAVQQRAAQGLVRSMKFSA